jgi:hypothetical protein
LAAPFLASFTGTASGETQDATWGTLSEGYVDIWLTPQSKRQLDLYQATVTPIAPATMLTDGDRVGVRFPARSGTGALSLDNLPRSRGTGLADGGLAIQAPMGRFELTQLQPTLGDELASGRCLVNGVESGGESLLRYDLGAGRLLADPVPAGQPLKVRVEEVPVYPTPEALEAFKTAVGTPPLGAPVFTLDTVVAHVTAEGVYVPPQP